MVDTWNVKIAEVLIIARGLRPYALEVLYKKYLLCHYKRFNDMLYICEYHMQGRDDLRFSFRNYQLSERLVVHKAIELVTVVGCRLLSIML